MVRFIIPVLAAIGLVFAFLYVNVLSNKPVPAAQIVAEPARAPFGSNISGAGIIEANSENVAIGVNVPGVVADVAVTVGDTVNAGDVLFRIDDTALLAERQTRSAQVAAAEARIVAAEANVNDLTNQLAKVQALSDSRAVSRDEVDRKRFAVKSADASLKSARADAAAARAQQEQVDTDIERMVIKAPIAATVLQINIRAGEYASAGALARPLMVLGNTTPLYVRVDIDENDAWRFVAGAPAKASLRGNPELKADLEFVKVEPYVIPKKNLTGDSIEKVDTRVLQAVYALQNPPFNAYVGQLMDVYIEAASLTDKQPATAPTGETHAP